MQFADELDNQLMRRLHFPTDDLWRLSPLDEGFFHPRAFNEHLWATSLHSAMDLPAVALNCCTVSLYNVPLSAVLLNIYDTSSHTAAQAYNDILMCYVVSMQ